MSGRAAAKAACPKAQAPERRKRFRVVGAKGPLNGRSLSLGEKAVRLPGMNGFGVEGPGGLKQKKQGEPGKNKPKPEQGRKHRDPNWWQHERMMM